jgi:hypothetical protein
MGIAHSVPKLLLAPEIALRSLDRRVAQTTERYLGCTQRIAAAVNDEIGIEPAS